MTVCNYAELRAAACAKVDELRAPKDDGKTRVRVRVFPLSGARKNEIRAANWASAQTSIDGLYGSSGGRCGNGRVRARVRAESANGVRAR